MLLGYHDVDREHILENIVVLELLRRDYRLVLSMDYSYATSYDGIQVKRIVEWLLEE